MPGGNAELAPLGKQQHSISALYRVIHVQTTIHVAPAALCGIHRHGVIYPDVAAGIHQQIDGINCRRCGHIISLGLETQTPQGYRLTSKISLEIIVQFLEKDAFLAVIDILNSLENLHVKIVLTAYLDQVVNVLRKQRTAVTAARENVFGTNAAVATHAMANDIDVSTHDFAQVGDLVHEAHASGKH